MSEQTRKRKPRRRDAWPNAWWSTPEVPPEELAMLLDPLITQLRRVDAISNRIASGEGRVADLVKLEKLLKEPFSLGQYPRKKARLNQPAELRTALSQISRELHLEIHATKRSFPSYLLCRVTTAWDTPDTVLDDLYVSDRQHDFFVWDDRFTILQRHGRSRVFIRLSPYRKKVRQHLAESSSEEPTDRDCDDVLESAATLVLGAAWYEDQGLPFHVADVFGLSEFRSALEQAAFILGSDLYQVATALQDDGETIVNFFEHVYDNRHLAHLVKRLALRGVRDLSRLESTAREAFVELNAAFSTFLSTTDAIRDLERLELYKIVLGNFGRLHDVAGCDYWTSNLERAVRAIEHCAIEHIDRLRSASELCGKAKPR